jgi:hypothetical protein
MTGPQRYAAGALLLAKADAAISKAAASQVVDRHSLAVLTLAAAQVHATLAVAAAVGCQSEDKALRQAWQEVTS